MENELLIPPSLRNQIPPMVLDSLKKMPAKEQGLFLHEFKRKSKSLGAAYLFWILFGLHYAYLGKWGMQFLFWLTVGGAGFWWIIDLFRMPSVINDRNQDVAMDAMRNMKTMM